MMPHRISHQTNVVVNNQSANSKIIYCYVFDWMLTNHDNVHSVGPWDILWAKVMYE